jgi:hypothetical protein
MKANTASKTAQYMALFIAIETVQHSHKRLFADPYAICFRDNKLKWAVKIAALPFFGGLIQTFIHRKLLERCHLILHGQYSLMNC